MEAAVVNHFIEGALYILDTTASVKALPETPFLKKGTEAQGDISGLLEMSGDIAGSASVSFSKRSILGIVSAMFGETMTEMNEEINDAVGEIANMISGHVTTKMAEMGKTVKVKLLEVKSDQYHVIEHSQGKEVLVLPFKTTQGAVVIEVSY